MVKKGLVIELKKDEELFIYKDEELLMISAEVRGNGRVKIFFQGSKKFIIHRKIEGVIDKAREKINPDQGN